MPLTTTQLRYYDHNVLRLPQDDRIVYNAQVDRLTCACAVRRRGGERRSRWHKLPIHGI